MKASSGRILLLFLAIFTGRVSSRLNLYSDEPGNFFRDLRIADVDLCDYNDISVGPSTSVYDQYIKRSLGSDALNGSVHCAPQPTLFQIKHPFHNYEFFYPSVIRLRRCGGNCGPVHPSILQCVATKTKMIDVRVFDTHKGGICRMGLLNHIKCVCECVTKADECDETKTFNTNSVSKNSAP